MTDFYFNSNFYQNLDHGYFSDKKMKPSKTKNKKKKIISKKKLQI